MDAANPVRRVPMTTKPNAATETADAPRVSDSDIRLARALARSFKRDHETPDERLLAIAALPLPEDERDTP